MNVKVKYKTDLLEESQKEKECWTILPIIGVDLTKVAFYKTNGSALIILGSTDQSISLSFTNQEEFDLFKACIQGLI